MQGLITLDLGNSHPHAGFFKKINTEWNFIQSTSLENLNLSLNSLGFSPDNSQVVVSEVKSYPEILADLGKQGFLITTIREYWKGNRFFGMPIDYTKSIGEDRLIQAFYTYKNKKFPTIVIDAGTFTTIDVITEQGFQGGFIIPSFESYFSLFKNGENLKNIEMVLPQSFETPHSSESAVSGGYSAFFLLVESLKKKYHCEHLILTGGRYKFWENFDFGLKKEVNPFYIHESLLHWMTTQIELL